MPEQQKISSIQHAASTAAGHLPAVVKEQELSEAGLETAPFSYIQFKLSVGAPDDPLEDEADAMADKVMRMPSDNFIQRCKCEEEDGPDEKLMRTPADNFVQRCSHCEEEQALQRMPLTAFIQRKGSSADTVASGPVATMISASKGNGNGMDSHTKTFMQTRFGADFSSINIHTGNDAIQMSRELHARAFTVGNDIYFNNGQYNPGTDSGKHLLAHELTHTVQQGGQSAVQQKRIQRTEEEDRAALREAPPPMPVFPGGASPEERERVRQEYLTLRGEYTGRLADALLAPLEGSRADGITFLNRLRGLSREQSRLLVRDEAFFTRVRRWFRGKSLWSVFTILYFNNHLEEPYLRLNYAVMNSEARLLTDMLNVVIPEYPSDRYFHMLREVCLTIFNGDPLLPEILRLIDHRNDEGIVHQLSGTVREAHYERNAAGNFALSAFSNHFSANAYISGNELRVVVRIRFVDGSDPVRCATAGSNTCQPYYFLGDNAHYYDDWQRYIAEVWNNKLNITNGTNTYAITFVPIFMSETDADAHSVRIISGDQRCRSDDTWARSYSSCWHLGRTSKNTVSHEFGHLVGASDEYNLPGSAQEITNAGITNLSAEDLSLTTVEGVTGTAAAADAAGGGHTQSSLMASTNNQVYERHLTRLVRVLNASMPAGSAAFRVTRH